MEPLPRVGTTVVLKALPPGFLNNLPPYDQKAIPAIVGKPLALVAYDERGKAELQFVDAYGASHSIWVDPDFLMPSA